jgi:ABC-type uncharacterized transport system permease subunit
MTRFLVLFVAVTAISIMLAICFVAETCAFYTNEAVQGLTRYWLNLLVRIDTWFGP